MKNNKINNLTVNYRENSKITRMKRMKNYKIWYYKIRWIAKCMTYLDKIKNNYNMKI